MSNYSNDDFDPSEMFKALSNTHRLNIFKRLCANSIPTAVCHTEEGSCCCVGDIGDTLDIAPSTLSHHLKELNRAGLVVMRRSGKTVECSVDLAVLERLAQFFTNDVCIPTHVEPQEQAHNG